MAKTPPLAKITKANPIPKMTAPKAKKATASKQPSFGRKPGHAKDMGI